MLDTENRLGVKQSKDFGLRQSNLQSALSRWNMELPSINFY